MRLILAHRHDLAARELAARWSDEALLLTPADLHEERLLLAVDERGEARAELPSRPEVVSVLSRLAGVGPVDLDHVDPRDLEYAATEFDAFLRALLTAWPGPVVNRPTTMCLNGPGWRPEQWVLAAAAVGLPVRPVRRLVPGTLCGPAAGASSDLVGVSVVGDRWFGAVPDDTGQRLCALARTSGCVLMEAMLDADSTVVHLGAWPDVSAPEVAAALAPILDGTS
jgi:hypothetical protein